MGQYMTLTDAELRSVVGWLLAGAAAGVVDDTVAALAVRRLGADYGDLERWRVSGDSDWRALVALVQGGCGE